MTHKPEIFFEIIIIYIAHKSIKPLKYNLRDKMAQDCVFHIHIACIQEKKFNRYKSRLVVYLSSCFLYGYN